MKHLEPFGPNAEENIRRVEKGEKVKFPADYREFLLTIGGGVFPTVQDSPEENRPELLRISGQSDGETIDDRIRVLFGCIHEQNWHYDIEGNLRLMFGSEDNPHKIIPIALTDHQNMFVMMLNKRKKDCGYIYYYDMQALFDISEGDDNCFYYLADNFTEFAELINNEDQMLMTM